MTPLATPNRTRWPALFDQTTRPVFVLNRNRRIRFVNEAWEKLAKCRGDDAHGRACLRRGPTEPLFRTLAPPQEAVAGRVTRVRRPAPGQKAGPPWWDVTFLPLPHADGAGYLGVIDVIAASPALPQRSVPASLGVLRHQHACHDSLDLFRSTTAAGERLRNRLRLAAAGREPVWIRGGPGSGKRTAARVIHHLSARRDLPFVTLDCAGLQPYLIDGLLWGTGGLAAPHRLGTLHLAAPQALPRELQQKIADWIVTTADAPKLISSATADAAAFAKEGSLLDAFVSSLSVIEINLPGLKDRSDELPALLHHFNVTPNDELLKVLSAHAWPGNLRELRDALKTPTLPRYLREKALLPPATPEPARPGLDELLATVEANLIRHALQECRGSATDAAAKLGIPRTRLVRRIEALKIEAGAS